MTCSSRSNVSPAAQHSSKQILLADGYAVFRKFCTVKDLKDYFMCPHTGDRKKKEKVVEIAQLVRWLPYKCENLALSSESTLQMLGEVLSACNPGLGHRDAWTGELDSQLNRSSELQAKSENPSYKMKNENGAVT